MPKKACGSTCKNPKDHSSKTCVCGGHSSKASHAKPKGKKPQRGAAGWLPPVLG
jgi:hypothetical protein